MAAADRITKFVKDLKAKDIRYVRFEVPDTHGVSRLKVVPIDAVAGYARNGLNMYGGVFALDTASSVVPGTGLHEEVAYSDKRLIPDLDTVQVVPWLPHTARVICDCQWAPGKPLKAAPRYVLKRLLDEAADMGFDVMMGHEFEFYLLDPESRQPLFGGLHIFNAIRNQYVPFLDEVLGQLQAVGIDVITHNCEYSPSQFETNFGPAVGLAAADKAFTFKNAMKELAHRAGYLATFMSKPANDMSGCGCHVHMSLIDRKSKKNAFADAKARDGMPDPMRAFTQGLLDHAPAMAPLIGPTPNCYRRLKPHTFAPSNISWGKEDRSAMVRMKHLGEAASHIEMRAASALSNPYLSAAAVLAAGLIGIKKKRKLQPAVKGPSEDNPDLPKLPQTLEQALDGLEADKDMRKLLGEDFVHVFTTVKRFELARFHDAVTEWERNEYLEVY